MRAPPGPVVGLFAGRYVIERVLGEGASAIVHLARDTTSGSPVAIKMLRPELAETRATDRFLREVRRTAALIHPHILPVLDSGDQDGQLYVVLPYMEGGTLRRVLKKETHLEFARIIEIARPIAEALDYAHQRGLVHRDVKPENILFASGQPCLGDFGIARALDVSGGFTDSSTSQNSVRGTPAYMSPEQAAGGSDLDGRSDVYSLGCVIYEMITGMQAFIGPTPESVISQRFVFPPREVRVYRPTAPPEVDDVLARAFAMIPADRFQRATELVNALESAFAADVAQAIVSTRRTPAATSRSAGRNWIVGGAITAVAAGVAIILAGTGILQRSRVQPDTTRIVVLPLQSTGSASPAWRDQDLLQQGIARWRGVSVVDQFQASDAIRRRGSVRTNDDAAAIAQSVGAGRFIRGTVAPSAARWRVTAALFDVARPQALYQASAELRNDVTDAAAAFSRLADSLLLRGALADSTPALLGTRSLPAMQEFSRGQLALDDWDVARADSAFQAASILDPSYARANLWLAQIRAWANRPRNTWASLAQRAADNADQLNPRERLLARALALLGQRDYERACAVYDGMHTRNERDFAAWFGSAQCRMANRLVVEDRRSPSGWRMQSSAHRAMQAYARAFEILPSVHSGFEHSAFENLRLLLLVGTDLRSAYGARDSAIFYARPGWSGDTLTLVPYPWQVVSSGSGAAIPPGNDRALRERRAEFRRLAGVWSTAFPRSAGAKHAVAVALELLHDATAIDTLRLARRLTSDPEKRRTLAAAEARLLVKFGAPSRPDYLIEAGRLADSLLASSPLELPADAEMLASLSALRGKCDQAELNVRRSIPGEQQRIPASLLADGQVVAIRELLGCRNRPSSPTLPELAAQITRTFDRRPDDLKRVDEVLLTRPALFSEPLDAEVLGRLAQSSNYELVHVAVAATSRDSAVARARLQRFLSATPDGVPGPDIALATARLWLALRDSAQAARALSVSLDNASAYDINVLEEAPRVAAFVRGMLLYAQLLEATDHAASARWMAAVRALWQKGDTPLVPR